MEGIGIKLPGLQSSLLTTRLLIAAELTITNSLLDKPFPERFAANARPLRITWVKPSAQAMQSGPPSFVTGANTTPNTGIPS
ncbi:hypothetical protein D3C84_691720 [compost metagenome]